MAIYLKKRSYLLGWGQSCLCSQGLTSTLMKVILAQEFCLATPNIPDDILCNCTMGAQKILPKRCQ